MSECVKDRPFPWVCGRCLEREVRPVVQDYRVGVRHGNTMYLLVVRDLALPTCARCGEEHFDNRTDDQIQAAKKALFDRPEELDKTRMINCAEQGRDEGYRYDYDEWLRAATEILCDAASRDDGGHVRVARAIGHVVIARDQIRKRVKLEGGSATVVERAHVDRLMTDALLTM